MRIISVKRLRDAVEEIGDPELEKDMMSWVKAVEGARWRHFDEIRQTFPKTDNVDGVIVFNIRHNRYRALTRVIYSHFFEQDQKWTPGQVLIGAVMTHADYDRWSALDETQRRTRLWPQR